MSVHPNVILMAVLTPDDLSRKTMRKILNANAAVEDEGTISIAGIEYHYQIMESDYCESWQILAKEGDLVFLDMVTYDYGESIKWAKLEEQKNALEKWAKAMSEEFSCSYSIEVTANYW
jgi:hypothetical protein